MKNISSILLFIFLLKVDAIAQGWRELGVGSNALKANGSIDCLSTDSGGIVYAGGEFFNALGKTHLAKWDGVSWSSVGDSVQDTIFNGPISAICIDGHHNIYVAGGFWNTNGYWYVAKWDGSGWQELGTGANALNANSDINSLCFDNAGNLYAAGDFTDSIVPSSYGNRYVAKWDGSSWSKLGTGANARWGNNTVYSIVVDSENNVYVGGDFMYDLYFNILKWDGTSWQEVGSGSNALNGNGAITTLHWCNGALYAAGFLRDDVSKYYVAKWDGSTWSELGTDVHALNANGFINSIYSDSYNNIYCGGEFSISDSVYVARWDGTNWSEVGTGANALSANADIYAVCTDGEYIYAAGGFTDNPSPVAGNRYVAAFDGKYLSIPMLQERTISVYPEPTAGQLTVETSVAGSFAILDMTGKVMACYDIAKPVVELRLPAGLSSGMYVGIFRSVDGNVQQVKIQYQL